MTHKILVVDDEAAILKSVRAYLEREGYTVLTAVDGPSALKEARTARPDLIVLDVMLPGMDGLEVLRRLRQESEVYVLMLTAKAEETDKVVGLMVGADDYLTKPFSPRELVARVKAILRRGRTGGTAETSANFPPPTH
jgi:two-component system, OmpR family, alkaline phosphatase synthesis response regulator PhoP